MTARWVQSALVYVVVGGSAGAFLGSAFLHNWPACIFEATCVYQALTIRMLLQQLRLLDIVRAFNGPPTQDRR